VPFFLTSLQFVSAIDFPIAHRQLKIGNALSLPLFVFRVYTNHPHHALAMNDLALVAHFFD
jgi:hypothetical protein